ncbi:MAG: hypothetical protein ACLFVJ_02315 [Persicimonas sp.]
MASQGLSKTEGLLLQRYYDAELSAAESIQAEQLLERSAPARVFLRALDELTEAARVAGEVAWERVRGEVASPDVIVELAEDADDLAQAPLEELAALLERFHDGEADYTEMAFVNALLDEREDVVEYLAELDNLQQGLRAAGEQLTAGVDFDGMWDRIEAQIGHQAGDRVDGADDQDGPDFDRAEHLILLQRFFDDEVTAEEAATVDRWLAQGDAEVAAYLEVLSEIQLGACVAVQTACERAPIRDIWTGVRAAIDEQDASGAGVVSLDSERSRRGGAGRGDVGGDAGGAASDSRSESWFSEYRQAIVGALAAAVVLAGMVGLFKDAIFGPSERVVVEKRVVVVDQVEYSPGSSVVIDSPMKQASMQDDGDRSDDSDEPTVIWLMDSEEETGAEQPADPEPAQGDGVESDDAGVPDQQAPDASQAPKPTGQPI